MVETITSCTFKDENGEKVTAVLQWDGQNVIKTHNGVVSPLEKHSGTRYLAWLNMKPYNKLNKYGKIMHDFLTARIGD